MDWLAFTITALTCTAVALAGLLAHEWMRCAEGFNLRPVRTISIALILTANASACVGLIAPIAN